MIIYATLVTHKTKPYNPYNQPIRNKPIHANVTKQNRVILTTYNEDGSSESENEDETEKERKYSS